MSGVYEPRYRGHVERPPARVRLDNGRVVTKPAGGRQPHREPRVGVMIHFDGSASDAGGLSWFKDPRAWNVGYHYYVLDDGSYYTLGPAGVPWSEAYRLRVYHAGRCRPSEKFENRAPYRDANSAFVGIATAATDRDDQAPVVELALAAISYRVLVREGLDPVETWRATGHEDEAWPRGRKHDPTGIDSRGAPQVPPVVDKAAIRHLIETFARIDR